MAFIHCDEGLFETVCSYAGVAVFCLVLIAGCRKTDANHLRPGATMSKAVQYSVLFENFMRNGQTRKKAAAKGVLSEPIHLSLDTGERVQSLLTALDYIVLTTSKRIQCYAATGKLAWQRAKSQSATVVCMDDQVVFQNDHYFLEAVRTDGKAVMRNLPIPDGMDTEASLRLLTPFKKTFLDIVQYYEKPEDYDAAFNLNYSDYGAPTHTWGHEFDGMMVLAPLYCENHDRIYLAEEGKIHVVDTRVEDAVHTFAFPVNTITNWSASDSGNLYLMGADADHQVLLHVDPAGTVLWRWQMPESEAWMTRQPPVAGSGGQVFGFASRHIYCVKSGRTVWQFPIENPIYGCAQADGALLFNAGGALFSLRSDGQEQFRLEVRDALAAPPTISHQGLVLVPHSDRIAIVK